MTLKMTGAEMVIRALADQGVEHIFGYPGGAVLPIYDELFQQDKVQHVLVRQEGGAVHAAEGYARSTGKVGVVLVTSGPGATNAVTGLTDALMDSIPVVCITGQVPTHLIGNDAFQECDTVGITRSVTKHNELVTSAADIPRAVREAFHIAQTGRPGPVLLDIPKDIVDPKNPNSAMDWYWPSDQRVAIIGTGHLSLELGGPRQFGPHGPDPEFDRKAVEWIASGDVEGCLAEVTLDSLHAPGNATHGFMDFMRMMGAAGDGVRADHVDSLDLFHTMEAYFTWYPEGAPA